MMYIVAVYLSPESGKIQIYLNLSKILFSYVFSYIYLMCALGFNADTAVFQQYTSDQLW